MKKKTQALLSGLVLSLFLIGTVYGAGLSIQLKRTNPGIAGEKSAEIIFDIVNTDMSHKIEGFIWCRSPDDAVVSSVLGVGSGSGAQYVGPKFIMDVGPSQKSMSLTIDADTPGDKRAGCTVKYAPFKETDATTETTTETIDYSGSIGSDVTDVSGFLLKMVSFTSATGATNETNGTSAKIELSVDGTIVEIEVGSSSTVDSLTIFVDEANENNATVRVTGIKTITTQTASTKQYQKMNGEYVATLEDNQYREIRLDKTVPFVDKMSNPQCPDGKTTCSASEVIDVGGTSVPKIWLYGVVALLVLLVVYLIGRRS